MPTQVQNNIVLPPIQKFVPPPEAPAQDAAPRRGEEFGEALKTARKKADAPDKPQPVKEKKKDTKAESKKDKENDSKVAGKSSAKPSNKPSESAKSSKPGKSKSAAHNDSAEIDETDTAAHAEDPTAAEEVDQTVTADETQTPPTIPQTKTPATAKDDPDQGDQTDTSAAAAATAASAHLVQAVDRAKDQNRREKNPEENADADENADTTVQAVTTAAAKTPASSATPATANAAHLAAQTDSPTAPSVSNAPHTKAVSIDLGGDAPVEIKPVAPTKPLAANVPSPTVDASAQLPLPPDSPDAPPADAKVEKLSLDLDPIARAVLESQGHTTQSSGVTTAPKTSDAPPPPPEVQFAQTNHDKIVTGVQTQLLPHGGTMEIRLDPPELGALKVMVEMRDGVMSATFQTSSEEATQLLSHSLNQLKHVLESQGVSVERLQVQQAPKSDSSNTKDDPNQRQQQGTSDDHAARQEQQRKEMMRRMWRRVSGAGDPIDYLA